MPNIGIVTASSSYMPNIVLRLRWTHEWNKHWFPAFWIGRNKSFTEEMEIPGLYGRRSKGSKGCEVQTKEISSWLEGSWERSSELATVLTVPRRDILAKYSKISGGPGLGSTVVAGRGLCMVSFDWSIVCMEGSSGRDSWSQIWKNPGYQGGSLDFINETVGLCWKNVNVLASFWDPRLV